VIFETRNQLDQTDSHIGTDGLACENRFPKESTIKKRKIEMMPLCIIQDNQSNIQDDNQCHDIQDTVQINQSDITPLALEYEALLCIIKSNDGPFPIINKSSLYVRNEYKDIYHLLIYNSLLITRHKFIITGTSGIEYLNHNSIWHLVDSVLTPEDVEAKTVIALSPRSIKRDEFQEFDKIIVKRFYMGPWSLEELLICQEHVFPAVPIDIMMELYNKAGGIPRYIFQRMEEAMKYHDPKTILGKEEILRLSFKRISDAILEISDFSDILKFFNEKTEKAHAWDDLLEKIQTHKSYPSVRGIMLELYVIHLFSCGDRCFEMRKLEEYNGKTNECTTDTKIYTIIPQPKIEYILTPNELLNHEEYKIILPSKSNFGAADLFITPNDIFQVTVSQRHPIKQAELSNLVTNMPARTKDKNAKIWFFFVVPDDIYSTFKYQDIIIRDNDTKTFRKVKSINPILNNLEQWVLKIDMKPNSC
ncbi:442_t:CDS:2, partial [Cetraspora pellucida]